MKVVVNSCTRKVESLRKNPNGMCSGSEPCQGWKYNRKDSTVKTLVNSCTRKLNTLRMTMNRMS